MLSLAAAPRPVSTRAPRNELYDVATACQTQEAIVIMAQMMRTTRRPKTSLQGMMMKLAYPNERTVAPVYYECLLACYLITLEIKYVMRNLQAKQPEIEIFPIPPCITVSKAQWRDL